MPKISKIEQILPRLKTRKKVAAYARVSMETEMLMHSLSAQVSYYSSLIQNNPEWEYVGVYADEGITGTLIRKRDEFKRLIADCKAGKIDLVLVKSISRFARDTVDTLETTRMLKGLGIDVYFERENIHSNSDEGELLLTLLASFAQQESISISENVKWGVRKRFKQGIPNGHKAPYGYEWNGEMFIIIKEQGEVVKEIYKRYLAGESAYSIAKGLATKGVKGQSGVPMDDSTVKNILSSISYTGTMILQKNYFTDNHVRKKNNGELPRYAVEEMFEPLVSTDDFEKAQSIMKSRAESMPNRNPVLTPFSGKIKCGNCGCSVSRRSHTKGKKWCCNQRERKGKAVCDMRPIYETELERAYEQVGEFANITVYDDVIEFRLPNGTVKQVFREYGGYKDRNGFSGKIMCGECNGKFERDKWVDTIVWRCGKKKSECGSRRITEDELRRAVIQFIGTDHYEARFVRLIDRVLVYNDRIEFHFKEGRVETWQRE